MKLTIILVFISTLCFAQTVEEINNASLADSIAAIKKADSTITVTIVPEADQVSDLASYDTQLKDLQAQAQAQAAKITEAKQAYLYAVVRGGGKTKQKVDLSKLVSVEGAVLTDGKGNILLRLKK